MSEEIKNDAPVDNSTAVETESQEQNAQEVQVSAPQTTNNSVKKFKLKVDGQEFDEEIDLSNEAELVKRLQLAKVAHKRMNEAAEYRKNYEDAETLVANFLEQLKSDPLSILKNGEFGIDTESLRDALVKEAEERAKKTPEQLELEKYRSKVESLEKERQEAEAEKQRLEVERLNTEAANELASAVEKAVENGDLPKSKYLTAKMMDLAHIAWKAGIDVPVMELIPVAKKMYLEDMKDMLGKLPDEMIESLVTGERIASIRKKKIAELKKMQATKPIKVEDVASSSREEKESKKMTTSEFFKNLGV